MGKEEAKMERREAQYWGVWSEGMEFFYFPSDAELKEYLVAGLEKSPADNILVVGGVKLFENGTGAIGGRKVLINKPRSLGWLCDATRTVRESEDRAIVISNYPRDWQPPRVRYVQAGTLIAKAEIGGMVEEVSAGVDTSLELCKPGDGRTLGIFFVHDYAAGYLNAVVMSQGIPRTRTIVCQVLASGDEISVPAAEHELLRAETDKAKVQEMLMKVAGDMELVGERERRMQETVFWTGEVLGP